MTAQVVIVSGGSRGLGLAIVRRLLERGDYVASFSRRKTPEIEALESSAELAPRCMYQTFDACDSEAVRGFVAAVAQRFGRIDGLVNNAAIAHDGVLALMGVEQIEQMLAVNLQAVLVLTKECVRRMLLQQGGSIVTVSSIVAHRGFSGLAAYAATKAGLIGMTRSLARELGPRNIRVNAVVPGFLATEMSESLSAEQRAQIIRRTPLGRLGEVEDVLPWIELLLSPESRFVTGEVITIDGGASL